MEDKPIDVKIVSKDEDFWTQILKNFEREEENQEKALRLNKKIIEMCRAELEKVKSAK